MPRPRSVTIVAVGECLAAAAFVLVLVDLIRGAKGSEYFPFIGAVLEIGLILLMFASAGALWKGKRWGWWLALLIDLLGAVIFLWDPVERHVWPDVDELAFIVLFALLLAWLFLPRVRSFFFARNEARALKES
jgi:hypothetical protein